MPGVQPSQEEQEESILVEQKVFIHSMSMLAGLSYEVDKVQSLTPERIKAASAADASINAVMNLLDSGDRENCQKWSEDIAEFFMHREKLRVNNGILMYKERIVIPKALRQEALEILHSGHQGVTAMTAIASRSIYWPGMSEAILKRRQACASCDRVAPSQVAAPPWPLPQPEFPFEMISTDYFSYAGRSYYVIVDRYSGWLSVYRAVDNGAGELIRTLKEYFSTFGIAKEMTSDGGSPRLQKPPHPALSLPGPIDLPRPK